MLYSAIWLLQDVIQVFTAGFLPAAEYFFLFLLFRSLGERESKPFIIWAAFTGGLVWDLRWTGFIGFTAGLYVLLLMLAEWIWSFIPETGKNGFLLAFFIWIISVTGFLVRIFANIYPVTDLMRAFLFQQALLLPVLVIYAILYSRRVAIENA